MRTGPAVLSPGFQYGFCHVTLGHLSGHLCYKWTRLFQRSLKTVIPCTCPNGDVHPGAPPSPYPAAWVPGAPGGLRGRELALPVTPPGPSSSTMDLLMPCPLPPPDRRVTPLWGKWGPTWLLSQHPASPLPSRVSGAPRPRGLGWPRDRGLAFAPPPTPTEGAARHSRCESTSLCVSVHTF